MKKLFLTFGLCAAVSVTFGQKKTVAEAMKLTKDKPNFEEARTKIKAALEHAETKDDANTWYTAGYIEDQIVTQEISKQILGKQPDEAVMYAALEKLYPYFVKTYELDNLPNEKGKVKPRFTKSMQSTLKIDLPYYMNAAIYFFEKQNYDKACNFFNDYIAISDSKLMKEGVKVDPSTPIDSNYIYANYYAALSASQLSDHNASIEAWKRAIKQDFNKYEAYRLLCDEYKTIGDSVNYEATLNEGFALFPKELYFMLNRANIDIRNGRSEKAIESINAAIKIDPTNANLYDVAARLYESDFNNLEKAEEYFKKSIEIDGESLESQSGLGRIYFNQGIAQLDAAYTYQDNKKSNEEKAKAYEFFQKALPYFEKAYQLDPNLMEIKIALRNIYYQLKMSEKLEEMEKLLEK